MARPRASAATKRGGHVRRERRLLQSRRAAEGRPLRPGLARADDIVSRLAKRGYGDHTQYDTTLILRPITHRFGLPLLDGLINRDKALAKNGAKPIGGLTGSLDLSQK